MHIAKTTIYDNLINTRNAYNLMQSTYGGSAWHYTDSYGNLPDLHHGLFGKVMNGGKHFIQLCI